MTQADLSTTITELFDKLDDEFCKLDDKFMKYLKNITAAIIDQDAKFDPPLQKTATALVITDQRE